MILIPINLKGMIAVSIVLIIISVVVIQRSSKEKIDYENTTGIITYLDKKFGNLPVRNLGKYRYLKIDNYEYPFEIFVGKESGDFKPKFEQIDKLQTGDTIIVYYYQTDDVFSEKINRFLQFIDKDDVSYFERGSSQKTLGVVILILSMLLLISSFFLWKKQKINF